MTDKRVIIWKTKIQERFQPEALRVQLAYTRTIFHSLELRVMGSPEGYPLERRGTFALRLACLPCLEKGDEVALLIVFEGDTPVPVRLTLVASGKPVRVPPLRPQWIDALPSLPEGGTSASRSFYSHLLGQHRRSSSVPVEVLTACSAEELLDGVESNPTQGANDLFAERELAIEAHHRVQRFFLCLDRETDFNLADPAWRNVMVTVGAELMQRLNFRAFHAERGKGISFFPPPPAILAGAGEISEVFVTCASELDGHPWKLVPYAFELFVAGRIAVTHDNAFLQEQLYSHGAANSWNYFMFAELAALCLENGIDAAFWEGAFASMVRTSELLSRNPAQPPTPEMTTEMRAQLYGYRDGRALRMADVLLARQAYDEVLAPLALAPDRLRRLCDSFGAVAASTSFHNFSSVWWTPGTLHPLAAGAPIGKALLDASSPV